MIWVTSSLAAEIWFKKHKSGSCLKFYWKHVPDVTSLTDVASREKAVCVEGICSKCQGLGREGVMKGCTGWSQVWEHQCHWATKGCLGSSVGPPGSWGFGFCRAPGGLWFGTSKAKGSKENLQTALFWHDWTEQWAVWRVWEKTFINLGLLLVCPRFAEHGKGLLQLYTSVSPLTASFCILLFSITVGILQSGITDTSTNSRNGPKWWSLRVTRKN